MIIASPRNSDAPARPTISSTGLALPATGSASDSSAIVPPSPWLSARITTTTYFSATTSTTAQKISDSTPYTVPWVAPGPAARSDSRNA